MSALTAFGMLLGLLFCLIGMATIVWLVSEGVQRLKGRIELGRQFEDCAVGDHLAIKNTLER